MNEELDRLPGGFLAFGDDSVVVSTNTTLRAMLGYQPGEMEGRLVESLLTVPSRIFYQTHVFPLLKMQGHVQEVYLAACTKTGEDLPILINGARFEREGRTLNECLLVAMRRRNEYEDEILNAKRRAERAIEERERMHEALLAANATLERQRQELVLRNCELESLKKGLEQRVRDRTAELSELVKELQGINYSIAHDLRAPMRAIIFTSTLLMEEAAENLSAEHLQMLERQVFNARKLSSLVDDLLQFSRLGLRELAKRPLDLSAMAREAGLAAIANQGRSDIELEVQPGIHANGDRAMIDLMLESLMENAVKYSPGGGPVTFGALPSPSDQLVCFVKDHGIGIESEFIDKIFKPFLRLHRDDQFPGNGIGLANAERIVRRHGGRIWCESRLGEGATFYFSLPRPPEIGS